MKLSFLPLTKINPPQPKRLLSRSRLLTSLEHCYDYRLVLVSAGTGYGKTSLLADFVNHVRSRMTVCWYSLDEGDRDPAVFCRYLLHAVRRCYPTFGESFEQMLQQNASQLHQTGIVTRLAEEFVCDLEQLQSLPSPPDVTNLSQPTMYWSTLIVLDDYQFAESNGVNSFVQRLLWLLPEDFHILIASRTTPQDLNIATLLIKQMVLTLGSKDLAFTTAEINQLLRELYNLDEVEMGEVLTTYSEGWISAVIMALSNQDLLLSNGNWTKFKTEAGEDFNTRQLFEYLAQEVFKRQPDKIQDFLLRTSVLDLLYPTTCDVLLISSDINQQPETDTLVKAQEGESELLLQQLETHNLFVTRRIINKGQVCYQYHSLLRHFLLSRLKQNKKLYRQMQLAAASIEKITGNYAQAVRHYIEAEEVAHAGNVLNEVAETLFENGRIEQLTELLNSIPEQAQNELPHLLNVKARLHMEHGDNETALIAYAEAARLYRQQGANDYAARAMANQAQLLIRTSQSREAIAHCTLILEDYPALMKTREGQQAVAGAKCVLGNAAIEEGNTSEVEKQLKEAAEIYKALGDVYRLSVTDSSFGHLYQRQGRLIKSNVYFERALAYFVKSGNPGGEADCRVSLAIGLYLQAQYHEAEIQLTKALVLTQNLDNQYLRLFLSTYLGNVYRDTERYSKAEAAYNEALELARTGLVRKMEVQILSEQAVSAILQGKMEKAGRLIRTDQELIEEYELPECAGVNWLNRGYLEFTASKYKNALVFFRKALSVFTLNKMRLEEVRTKFNIAVVLAVVGESKKALNELNESLYLAQELGIEPFLSYELKWAAPLLEYAVQHKVSELTEEFLRRHNFSSIPDSSYLLLSVEAKINENTFWPPTARPNLKALPAFADSFPAVTAMSRLDSTLYMYALDGGRVWKGNQEVEQWRTNKARELLFYLVENGRSTRDELLEALWPEDSFESAYPLLRVNLFNLRKAIAPVEIKLATSHYYIDGEVWYDAQQFNAEIKSALSVKKLGAERLLSSLDLYKRDFLNLFYSNWVVERQQELLHLYMRGLERLALYYQEQDLQEAALLIWQRLLDKDPYNENAYHATIACLLTAGNKSEALRQANKCRKALAELNLEPSPQMSLLLEKNSLGVG